MMLFSINHNSINVCIIISYLWSNCNFNRLRCSFLSKCLINTNINSKWECLVHQLLYISTHCISCRCSSISRQINCTTKIIPCSTIPSNIISSFNTMLSISISYIPNITCNSISSRKVSIISLSSLKLIYVSYITFLSISSISSCGSNIII